jgi:predicted N-acetyltransferase YhbS
VGVILEAPHGYSIERLDTTLHRREGFSCGTEVLDSFLQNQASQAQLKNISTTHVLLDTNAQADSGVRDILGYVTLTPATIPLIEVPDRLTKRLKGTQLQAQLIARMAVDLRYQGRKLGQFLLVYALKCCWEMYKLSAYSLVIVDAKDENVKPFYIEKGGFLEMPDRRLRLYRSVESLNELFSN